MSSRIVALLPDHHSYVEPFAGGLAVFFKKEPSKVEVINDMNRELINFYKVLKHSSRQLERLLSLTLHSRDLHRQARVVYHNPDMFDPIRRAWAVWVLANMSFASQLGDSWGYGVKSSSSTRKIRTRVREFSDHFAERLQHVQIECTDALKVIKRRDSTTTLLYCDPPYHNSDCGHYGGYNKQDFEQLLQELGSLKGKFLLSSYPSPPLREAIKEFGWESIQHEDQVVVNSRPGTKRKKKIEVLTANFQLAA